MNETRILYCQACGTAQAVAGELQSCAKCDGLVFHPNPPTGRKDILDFQTLFAEAIQRDVRATDKLTNLSVKFIREFDPVKEREDSLHRAAAERKFYGLIRQARLRTEFPTWTRDDLNFLRVNRISPE